MLIDNCLVRGVGLKTFQNYVDTQLGSGTFEKTIQTKCPDFKFPITSSDWYPALQVMKSFHCFTDDLSISYSDLIEKISKTTIVNDLHSHFSVILKIINTVHILSFAPLITSFYFNFLKISVIANYDGFFKAKVSGIPDTPGILDWLVPVFNGAFQGILFCTGKSFSEFSAEPRRIVNNQIELEFYGKYVEVRKLQKV